LQQEIEWNKAQIAQLQETLGLLPLLNMTTQQQQQLLQQPQGVLTGGGGATLTHRGSRGNRTMTSQKPGNDHEGLSQYHAPTTKETHKLLLFVMLIAFIQHSDRKTNSSV
jgi:hypothetical protein